MRSLVMWSRRQGWVVDLPLYAVFLFLAPNLAQSGAWPGRWVPMLFVLPLLVRRRWPRTVAALMVAGGIAQYSVELWAYDRGRTELGLAVMIYTLVKRGDRITGGAVAACALTLDIVWTFTWGAFSTTPVITLLGMVPLHLAAWALGEFARAREKLVGEEQRTLDLIQAEQQARARAEVAEERSRIARELHDVLAHGMSVIVLNAEGAKLAWRRDPDVVDRTLDTIGRTGRDALAELRRLLEVLHAGEEARRPQPTLAELRTLVEGAGRELELDVTGEPDRLPASAALQAYRIVQEAVTNMIKHAPPDATGRVQVAFTPGRIRIEVINSGGHAAPRPALPSSGRGLAGMAQRVALYHGDLDTGPLPDGGYRVAATLVVPEAA